MRKFIMFITDVCVLFLIKLRWPRNKSLYDTRKSAGFRGTRKTARKSSAVRNLSWFVLRFHAEAIFSSLAFLPHSLRPLSKVVLVVFYFGFVFVEDVVWRVTF